MFQRIQCNGLSQRHFVARTRVLRNFSEQKNGSLFTNLKIFCQKFISDQHCMIYTRIMNLVRVRTLTGLPFLETFCGLFEARFLNEILGTFYQQQKYARLILSSSTNISYNNLQAIRVERLLDLLYNRKVMQIMPVSIQRYYYQITYFD